MQTLKFNLNPNNFYWHVLALCTANDMTWRLRARIGYPVLKCTEYVLTVIVVSLIPQNSKIKPGGLKFFKEIL